MRGLFSIDILRAEELGGAEQAAWRRFRAASPELDSPYFDVRYALAAGAVVPHARIAVLHRYGRPVGFFPFQRRLGVIQPLGAPMTDYHGIVAAPGERIDLAELLCDLGARAFRFSGLKAGVAPAGGEAAEHPVMATDLSGGFDRWLEASQARHPRFFKGKRRALRAIERDLGPLRLEWSRENRGLLDYVVALKRAQYRRTRRHDVFACGWTEQLLRRLDEARADDFGRADADYKTYFAQPAGTVAEGCIRAPGRLTSARQWLSAAAPPLAAFGQRARRRIDVIAACETTVLGWCAGAAGAAGAAVPHHSNLQPERRHAHRSGSQVVSRSEGGVRQGADDLHASAG